MSKFFIVAAVVMVNFAQAQIAEQLFMEKYSKVGLEFVSQLMLTTNTANIASFKWEESRSIGAGATYNFYQKKDLNLKAGVFFNMFDINTTVIATDNNNVRQTYAGEEGRYALFSLPIDAEYYFKITTNTLFSVQAGPELTTNNYGYDVARSVRLTNNTSVETFSFSKKPPIFFGMNIGASVSFLTKSTLLKVNVKYHRSFSEFMYKGNSTITIDGTDSFATQLLTGSYIGFGISIYPNKDLFNF